jgi:hypothetical protein
VSAPQPQDGLRLKPEPRRVIALLIVLVLAAAGSGIAARGESAQSPSCNATLVRYEWNKRAGGGPWIAVGPSRARLEGWLYSHEAYYADGRANRSEGFVVRAGVEEKIGWFSRKWGGSPLRISGRRLDGEGSFAQTFRAVARGAGWYPSGLRVPQPGCWQLTLRTKGWVRQVVVEAIEPSAKGTCDATPVSAGGRIPLTPRRSRVFAGWGPWVTPEGGALLYTGGRTPDGGFTKVLWSTTRSASVPSGDLVLRGTQLDGNGAFRQTLPSVGLNGPWPSHVVVPTSGCWLLTARIGGLPGAAGIMVVRVV